MWGMWRAWWAVTHTWSTASKWTARPTCGSSITNAASTNGWPWSARRGKEGPSPLRPTSTYSLSSWVDRWMWRHTARYNLWGTTWVHWRDDKRGKFRWEECKTGNFFFSCCCPGDRGKLVLQESGLESCPQHWAPLDWGYDLARYWLQTWCQGGPVALWCDERVPHSSELDWEMFKLTQTNCASKQSEGFGLVWNETIFVFHVPTTRWSMAGHVYQKA